MNEPVQNMCRICLKTNNEYDKMVQNHNIIECIELIKEYIGIDMVNYIDFPYFVCKICSSELTIVVNFVYKCRMSNKKLKEAYENNTPLLEISAIQNNDHVLGSKIIKAELTEGMDIDDCFDNSDNHVENSYFFVNRFETENGKSTDEVDYAKENKKSRNKVRQKMRNRKSKLIINDRKYETSLKCHICGAFRSSNTALMAHLRIHTGEKPFECPHCHRLFTQRTTLDQHIWRIHKRNVYLAKKSCICDICGKQWFNKSDLRVHMRIHTNEKPYKCTFCTKSFSQTGTLRQHLRMHTGERPFPCSVCGKTFKTQTDRRTHLSVHSDKRNFVCTVCNKGFKTKDTLKNHVVNLHTSERHFVCEKCGVSFTQKGNLKSHINSVHSERAGTCEVCNKSFSDLMEHSRIHTGEKCYNCEVCGKGFHSKRPFSAHLRKHREATKFACTELNCTTAFPSAGQLKFHIMKFHTTEFPYECNICAKGYYRLSDLSKHLKINSCKNKQVVME